MMSKSLSEPRIEPSAMVKQTNSSKQAPQQGKVCNVPHYRDCLPSATYRHRKLLQTDKVLNILQEPQHHI